jgi:MmgE/PrpD N-terminal domain
MYNEKIINFTVNTNYANLPKGLLKFTRLCILDTIGACLDGIGMLEDPGQPTFLKKSRSNTKAKEAGVIGTRCRFSAGESFQNNCRSCCIYDQDGMLVPAQAYPGRQVILAALAAAEKFDASIQDAVTVIVITYELLLRTGLAVRDIGWPSNSQWPSKQYSAYCFTVPGISSIVLSLINSRSDQSGIMSVDCKTASLKAEGRRETSADQFHNLNRNGGLQLLVETLRLLQNGIAGGFFPVQIGDDSIIREIAGTIVSSSQLTYRLGQKYLLMEQGFKPAIINRYLHHPLAAVKLALGNKALDVNSIKALTLTGLSLLLTVEMKHSREEVRLMALLLVFLGAGVDPEAALVLSGSFNRDSISPLKHKIKFKEDQQAWVDYFSGSYDFPFSAKIDFYAGFSKEARAAGEIFEIKDISTEKRLIKDFGFRTYIIGDERGRQLSRMLVSDDNFAVKDLMRLTGPTWWYCVKTSLYSLFSRPEPEDE